MMFCHLSGEKNGISLPGCEDQRQGTVNSVRRGHGHQVGLPLLLLRATCTQDFCVLICKGVPWASCRVECPPALTCCDLKERGLEQVTAPEVLLAAEGLTERWHRENTLQASFHVLVSFLSYFAYVCLSQKPRLLKNSLRKAV